MIELPKGAFMVLQDEVIKKEDKVKTSLILTLEDEMTVDTKPNTGMVTATCESLKKYQTKKLVFRENFAEKIMVDGTEFLFFRDWDASIFYVILE